RLRWCWAGWRGWVRGRGFSCPRPSPTTLSVSPSLLCGGRSCSAGHYSSHARTPSANTRSRFRSWSSRSAAWSSTTISHGCKRSLPRPRPALARASSSSSPRYSLHASGPYCTSPGRLGVWRHCEPVGLVSDAIVAALGTLFGGGALVGIVQGWVSHKKGIRDADVERDQTAFEQMKVILLEHKESIAELKAARDKDTRRLDDLSEENRLYRWTLIGVTDRLRQKPQGTVDDILDYLHERLPMLRKERDE